MKNILNNNFKSELILIGARPAVGKTALLIKLTKDFLEKGKKVLFLSLEINSELLLKRMNLKDDSNLIIKDNVIKDLTIINDTINNYKPDIVIIDYLQLLPQETELAILLKQISKEHNIPIIVTSQLSRACEKLDLSQINIEELISMNKSLSQLINESNIFSILYEKEEKVILYKEMKNCYGLLKEIDIREILN